MSKKLVFLGLGEVGSRYAAGLKKEGADVKGYDILLNDPLFADKVERCKEYGVELAASMEDAIAGADYIFVPTSCHVAVDCAKAYAPYLKPGMVYVDWNSAVPTVKDKVREVVEATGADFVDAVTMMSPNQYWHKNPCIMSGPRAKEVADYLNGFGMNITYAGGKVGQASALKVLRSIFTKGFEAVLVECLASARAFGIMDEIFTSICRMLDAMPPEENLSMMVRTDVVHAKRRGEEIGAIADMLEEMCMNNIMAKAATEKLMWVASTDIKDHFHSAIPEDLHECVDQYVRISKNG